jgi:sugar phosphate isomerase/epimerase
MLLAYNTNGFAHHSPAAALEILAGLGYQGVGLTLDYGWLNPYAPDFEQSLAEMRRLLEKYSFRSVIETGARFLLDPRTKHEPTLMTAVPAQRQRRIDFYRRAIDVAAALKSDCVSLWSGVLRDDANETVAFARLVDGLREVCAYAAQRGVVIGFEPEPGMFIDTIDRFGQLLEGFDSPALKLTIDIGHLHCLGEPIAETIRGWRSRLRNVHIEDMRRGVHEHLMFGDGEIGFRPVMAELAAIDYQGLVQVELSRHSHMAPEAARRAMGFLKPLTPDS